MATGDHSKSDQFEKREMPADSSDRRFYVRAPSISVVRKALFRAPGGAKVVGRFDRATILCSHTMDEHSLRRHWPVIKSRLEKAGLVLVERPSPKSDPRFPHPPRPFTGGLLAAFRWVAPTLRINGHMHAQLM
jgi:hypothetical protein